VNRPDPYEAFLSASRAPAPDCEPDDPEAAFLASEAALSTGGPSEPGPVLPEELLQAFGLAGPDAEAGA
jgi:hypothetical protein